MSLWFKKLFGSLTLDDLPKKMPDARSMRKGSEILIIDDEPLTYEKSLRSMGFRITVHDKWNSVEDVVPFQIVITDNNGVANHLKCSGITMACEAERMYPEKRYAVYSGDLIDSRDKERHSFPILTKGDTVEDWQQMLDKALEESCDPRKAWRMIGDILNRTNITEKEKRSIQHAYVKAILDGSTDSIENRTWTIHKDTVSLIVRIASLCIGVARLSISLGL